MCILVTKNGIEKYANTIYTSSFFLPPDKRYESGPPLIESRTYTPHERIICGPNGCFGMWEIGHIVLRPGDRIGVEFTRKVLCHMSYHDHKKTHIRIRCMFEVTCTGKGRYTLNYWGYNGGEEISEMLYGGFKLIDEQKERYKLGVPLSKLPF